MMCRIKGFCLYIHKKLRLVSNVGSHEVALMLMMRMLKRVLRWWMVAIDDDVDGEDEEEEQEDEEATLFTELCEDVVLVVGTLKQHWNEQDCL